MLTELSPIQTDYDWLLCADCGSDYLHQEAVEIYCRYEDADADGVRVEQTSGLQSAVPGSQNPSERRQGLVVEFRCENCPARPRLVICQHKGQTSIGWQTQTPEA